MATEESIKEKGEEKKNLQGHIQIIPEVPSAKRMLMICIRLNKNTTLKGTKMFQCFKLSNIFIF